MTRKFIGDKGHKILVFGRKWFKLITISPRLSPGEISRLSKSNLNRSFSVYFKSMEQKDELEKIFGKRFSVFVDEIYDSEGKYRSLFNCDPTLTQQLRFNFHLGVLKVKVPKKRFNEFLDCLKELRENQYRIQTNLGNYRTVIR